MFLTTKPSRRELYLGCAYLCLYLAVLPWLIPVGMYFLVPQATVLQVNLVFFTLNFAAVFLIFRRFLCRSFRDALKAPMQTLFYAVLGFLGAQTLVGLVTGIIAGIAPEFANINDQSIQSMAAENFTLMALGSVVLAPVTEELLFRGVIFRGLYDRSPLGAQAASMVLFSAVHISGYIGSCSPKVLLLCFLQYLPAAYCLNFAYRRGGTIIAPILTHMLVNLSVFSAMR